MGAQNQGPSGQNLRKLWASGQASRLKKIRLAKSKQHLRTVFPKAQLGFKGFSTYMHTYVTF